MITTIEKSITERPRRNPLFLIALLLLSAGWGSAEPGLSAKSHFLAAANIRDEAAEIRMAYARKIFGNARDMATLPAEEPGQHRANLHEAANTALTSARHAAKAVANYDKATSVLRNITNYSLPENHFSTLDQEDYVDRAEKSKEKALLAAIFVAEAYEWAAGLYAQIPLSQDKQAGSMEQASAWRENIANRILQE